MRPLALSLIFSRNPPRVYEFDHQFPCVACTNVPVVILYGQLGTAKFAIFHSTLLELVANEEIVYIFRHFYKVPFEVLFVLVVIVCALCRPNLLTSPS